MCFFPTTLVNTLVRSPLKSTLILIALLWGSLATAHGTRPAVSDIYIDDDHVRIEIYASFEPFLVGMNLSGLLDTDDAPNAAAYDAMRALPDDKFQDRLFADWTMIAKGLKLTGAGPLTLDKVEIDPEPDLSLARDTRVYLSAPRDPNATEITFGWVAENGALVVRHGTGDTAWATMIEGGQVSKPIQYTGGVAETTGQVIWRFLVSGFDHIIPKGLDHILFVLGLYLFALAWRPLFAQVTAFTLAHTVTLGLATVGVITIPDHWMWFVETLIALSIAYVAIENIFRPQLGWWRIVVVFGFGLLHGLGFASVLSDFGLAPSQFIISLLAFNVGVEVGQLAVILTAFVVLGLTLGKSPRYRQIVVIPGSLAIAAVGLYWVVERAFL